jgi:hypothetical protein
MVIIRRTEPEHHAGALVIVFGKGFVLQKILDLIVGILDGEAAVFIDPENTEPTVTGADQMSRREIHGNGLSGPDKHIPEGTEAFFFCLGNRDAVALYVPAYQWPGIF